MNTDCDISANLKKKNATYAFILSLIQGIPSPALYSVTIENKGRNRSDANPPKAVNWI